MNGLQFPQALAVRQKGYSISELGLCEEAGHGSLTYITRVARRIFSADMALIGVLEEGGDRQILVSGLGLPEEYEKAGSVPLSKSFSQFVRRDGQPLAVDDKDSHPLGAELGERENLPYKSYLGAPIFAPSGETLGALCVLDRAVRHWSNDDIAVLEDLAHCVTDAIMLRAALLTSQQLHRELEKSVAQIRHNIALRDTIVAAFTAPEKSAEERLVALLEAGCRALNMSAAAVTRFDGSRTLPLVQFRRSDAPAPVPEPERLRSLTAHVLSGQQVVCFRDAEAAGLAGRVAFDGSLPCCFVGAPLVIDGVAYGTLEFVGDDAHCPEEPDIELSVVSVIAMFTITQLEVFAQIDRLKKSESTLLQYILELRAQK